MPLRLLLFACFAAQSVLAATASDPCANITLPAGVEQVLKQQYPDWRPKTVTDLEGYDQKLWLSTNPRRCPGIATGHFEQANQLAYALLLVPNSGQNAGYKVIIVVRSDDHDNYAVRLLDQGKFESGMVISRERPGKHTGLEATESVTLKFDGLNVEWLEKSSVLYYYADGSYHQLQTSD